MWRVITSASISAVLVGCSSSESCPEDLPYLSLTVTVVDPSGTPICDAYVTDSVIGAPCVPNGCSCRYHATPDVATPAHSPQNVTMIVSRRGFAPVVDTQSLSKSGTCEDGERSMTITLHPAPDAGGCVPRDAVKCADHRTCYDGASSSGCTATDETSSDPGASYVCCQ